MAASYGFETAGIDLGPVYVNGVFTEDSVPHKGMDRIDHLCNNKSNLHRFGFRLLESKMFQPKRSTSVHGTPKVIISNNVTNLIGADLQAFMAGTTWKFNIDN